MLTATLTPRQHERYASILASLDQPHDPSPDDRRRVARTAFRAPFHVSLLAVPGHPPMRIMSQNLSPEGLAFTSGRPFAHHEPVVLHLELCHYPPRLVLCRVIHCRQLKTGHYETGLEFLQALPGHLGTPLPPAWLTAPATN